MIKEYNILIEVLEKNGKYLYIVYLDNQIVNSFVSNHLLNFELVFSKKNRNFILINKDKEKKEHNNGLQSGNNQ